MIINATEKRTRKQRKKKPEQPKRSTDEQRFLDSVSPYYRTQYHELAHLIGGSAVELFKALGWPTLGVETVRGVGKYLAAFDSPPKLDEKALAALLRGLPPESKPQETQT